MKFPNKAYLEQLRKQYPKGTKLQMITMRNEKYPVPPGTIGEVTHIDDIGNIHVLKLSITLDTLTARILKLSSDSQS